MTAYMQVFDTVKLGDVRKFVLRIGHRRPFFRPDRLLISAPCPGFMLLELGKITWGPHESPFIGNVLEDAYMFAPHAFGMKLELPTLKADEFVTMYGYYTGAVPSGFIRNSALSIRVMWAQGGTQLMQSEDISRKIILQ